MPPLTTHAPPKLLAKQWFQAYEFAPAYVGPMILLGASSNALLAYFTSSPSSVLARGLYVVAAGAMASVVPYTMLYMEPGVNGAGKCKVQGLLREDGFLLKGKGKGKVTEWDSASEEARRWAETVDMKVIVQTWARTNAWSCLPWIARSHNEAVQPLLYMSEVSASNWLFDVSKTIIQIIPYSYTVPILSQHKQKKK
ncbi:DUF1772 domain containing protein [Pyrenophora teres f. maculata]|nr:DUF1772 domain containing protein [Pyrenophora teres f. maculata]